MGTKTVTMPEPIEALRTHLAVVADLRSAAGVLGWDQETYMPRGGAAGRAMQLATLSRLAHEAFISATTVKLLEAAEGIAGTLDPDADDAALVREVRRDYDRLTKLPAEFVAERAREASLSTEVWKDARKRNDFAAYRPSLEKMV
ncbi:MAG TPA: carboxypeptidase M32, partial [bacterium]